jgi:hypothetical protein
MGPLRRLAGFLYDFVVGDDPRIAAAVALALGLTGLIAGVGVPAWWVLPVVVVAVLSFSIHRTTAPRNRTIAGAPKLEPPAKRRLPS